MAEQNEIQIDPETYQLHLRMIFHQAAVSRHVKAQAILDAMNRADTLGPVLDPTLWINAHTTMDAQREIVRAYIALQQTVEKVMKEHGLEDTLHAIVST